MGVHPVTLDLEASREMQLPDAVKRQHRQKPLDGLAAVERVAVDVVEVQQDPAISALGHRSHELTVPELIRARAEVVDSGLDVTVQRVGSSRWG